MIPYKPGRKCVHPLRTVQIRLSQFERKTRSACGVRASAPRLGGLANKAKQSKARKVKQGIILQGRVPGLVEADVVVLAAAQERRRHAVGLGGAAGPVLGG